MRRFHFEPIAGNAPKIMTTLLQSEEINSCRKEKMALRLAAEELVVNVVSYAYPQGKDGYLDVEIEKDADSIVLRFIDGGVPFNPLEQKPPDITASKKDRKIGGLGILFVIKMMDEVGYAYMNQENILTIKKQIKKED